MSAQLCTKIAILSQRKADIRTDNSQSVHCVRFAQSFHIFPEVDRLAERGLAAAYPLML